MKKQQNVIFITKAMYLETSTYLFYHVVIN